MTPNQANDAIAVACGLSPVRLHSLNVEVRDGRWPVVRALYVPEGGGELIRVLATLTPREDITHVELPEAPTAPPT